MKTICLLAVVLALCAGGQATTSFDLVKGSPVSVIVEFDRSQGFIEDSLSGDVVSNTPAGRRHLLDLTQPANTSSDSFAADALRILTSASSPDSTASAAGRHLLQTPLPFTLSVPISAKKSALGGFVSVALDLSGANTTAVLTFLSQFRFSVPGNTQLVANAQIVVFPDVSGKEIVDIIGTDFFLGSDGKGRMETFGFKADVNTFQAYTPGANAGAQIFLAFEIQGLINGIFRTAQGLIPATKFTIEKASLPTLQGIVDTLC